MFQGVERPSEIIFCILGIEKSDFDEVVEVLFEVGKWPLDLKKLPSARLKKRLW
jgi:hypothetical protein